MKYFKTFDCDFDPMYVELKDSFYNAHKEDIDNLIKHSRSNSIVGSIDFNKDYSIYYEDFILELIYCMKCELKELEK